MIRQLMYYYVLPQGYVKINGSSYQSQRLLRGGIFNKKIICSGKTTVKSQAIFHNIENTGVYFLGDVFLHIVGIFVFKILTANVFIFQH